MEPDKSIYRSGQEPAIQPTARRSTFSLPFIFRTSKRRPRMLKDVSSIIDPPELPSPTCAERNHYPVFDPSNPQHNPPDSRLYRRMERQTSSSDSQKQPNWVHGLPIKSLRKAQSGFLAIRAGLFRRPQPSISVDDMSHMTLRHGQGVSSITTQEDLSFGCDLYRTAVSWSSPDDHLNIDALVRAGSFHPLTNIISAPVVLQSLNGSPDDFGTGFAGNTIAPVHLPPAALSSNEHDFCSSRSTDTRIIQVDGAAIESTQTKGALRKVSLTASTDWETLGGTSTGSVNDDDGKLLQDLTDVRHKVLDKATAPNRSNRRSDMTTEWSTHCVQGTSSCESCDEQENAEPSRKRKMPKSRRGPSIMRASSSMWSTISSNTSHGGSIGFLQSEAFVTQERLIPDEEPSTAAAGTCSTSSLTEGSVEATIAFPGIHHELLDQWRSESLDDEQGEDVGNIFNAERKTIVSHDQFAVMTTFPRASNLDYDRCDLPYPIDENATCTDLPRYNSDQLEEIEAQNLYPRLERDVLRDSQEMSPQNAMPSPTMGFSSAFLLASIQAQQPEAVPDRRSQSQNQRADTRHSFGLHISLPNEPGGRAEAHTWRQRDLHQFLLEQQPFADTHYAGSNWGWDGMGTQYDDSDYSTNFTAIFTPGSTMSQGETSATSISSLMWSPLHSPIDEEVLFPPVTRNEYWSAAGKTSSFYPDRGNEPVKAGRDYGIDATCNGGYPATAPLADEYQEIPWTTSYSSQSAVHAMIARGGSDSTDDFYPG
ncbi:hypothetical protein N7456_001787 [Penicillium angulare]|uniref:Uncharacterized protein n=1 Tax=Penicillium angulare TaxID=116970 RepID=A0A9W9G7D6_9EURO|nr:hypothetical protein N7456_001787 [Penicillium angulare]